MRAACSSRDTIMRLIVRFGEKWREFMDEQMRGLSIRHWELDEQWTYCGKKQARLTVDEKQTCHDQGAILLWIGIDQETRLAPRSPSASVAPTWPAASPLTFAELLETVMPAKIAPSPMVQSPLGNWRGFFMRFTTRDLLWMIVVVGLCVALWIENRKRQAATQHARDRALEAEYWLGQTLKIEKEAYGTVDSPKGKYAKPKPAEPISN